MDTKSDLMASRQGRFEAHLASHLGIVFRVVRMYSRESEDQQDLAQEIKLQLWSAFAKYDESRSFSTWMYRISLNTAISWNRKSTHRRSSAIPLDEIGDLPATPSTDENLQALYQMVEGLDALNRALLLLYLDDLSHAEIGDVLGISASNAATKISRLKDRLRRQAQPKE